MRYAIGAALLIALVLWALTASAAGTAKVVVTVGRIQPTVNGRMPGESLHPLKPSDPIKETMSVRTEAKAAASLTIGARQGAVLMGPESELVLRRGVVDVVTGAADELDFLTVIGQFRFVFVPPPKAPKGASVLGVAPHRVVITGPNGEQVRLYGTDVNVTVTKGDMAVYVVEGEAEVTSGKVAAIRRLGAGQWTRMVEDEPPTTPVSFRLAAGLNPGDVQGIVLLSDPPGLDLTALFQDLPK